MEEKSTPDILVQFKVKNNLLYSEIMKGYETVSSFCRAFNFRPSTVGGFLNLKKSPFTNREEKVVKKEVVKVIPAKYRKIKLEVQQEEQEEPQQQEVQPKPQNWLEEQQARFLARYQELSRAKAEAQQQSIEWKLVKRSKVIFANKVLSAMEVPEYLPIAVKISEALGCQPEELFPFSLYKIQIPRKIEKFYYSQEILKRQLQMDQVSQEQLGWEKMEQSFVKEEVAKVLATLSPREVEVLEHRFGLVDGCSKTLREVGEAMGVTMERVRQLEAKAICKLRHPTRSRVLRQNLN